MIKLEDCKNRRVYKIHSRNLLLGVFDATCLGFIGIREKFGELFLFTEYHWDNGPPHGTVKPLEDTGIDLPRDINLSCHEEDVIDLKTKRIVIFDSPKISGGKGWYFKDTGEFSDSILPYSPRNEKLFEYLSKLEGDYTKKAPKTYKLMGSILRKHEDAEFDYSKENNKYDPEHKIDVDTAEYCVRETILVTSPKWSSLEDIINNNNMPYL